MLSSLYLSRNKALLALLLGAGLAVVAWFVVGPQQRVAGIVLAFALAWASVVDIDRYILPDLITLPLILIGLGLAAMQGGGALLHSAIGAAAGYGVLVAVELYYRRVRGRDGLGRGDAKLLAAAGAWVGWAALPPVLLIGSVSGLVWAGLTALRRGKLDAAQPIAFGPFIALGFWLVWLAADLLGAFGTPSLADFR